jgi:hypothetical protein
MVDPLHMAHADLVAAANQATRARATMHAHPDSADYALAFAQAADHKAVMRERYEDLVLVALAKERPADSATA